MCDLCVCVLHGIGRKTVACELRLNLLGCNVPPPSNKYKNTCYDLRIHAGISAMLCKAAVSHDIPTRFAEQLYVWL